MKGFSQSTAKGFAMRFFSKKRQKPSVELSDQSFILEPILTPSGIVDGSDDNDPSILALTASIEEIDDVDSEIDLPSDLNLPESLEILDRTLSEVELEPLDFAIADSEIEMLLDPEIQPELDFSTDIELPESAEEASVDSLDLEQTTNENALSDADENVALETEDGNATLAPEEAIAETEPLGSEVTQSTFEAEEAIASEEISNDVAELAAYEETEISNSEPSASSIESSDLEVTLDNDTSAVTPIDDLEGNLPENEIDSPDDSAPELIDPILPPDIIPQTEFTFDSGVFTVGESGVVGIDFLFDGGAYKGELGMFSLEGMNEFEPGSEAFIQEAARRALSQSEL
ncbi:hypothetical protein QM565_10775, partial [Geitlerinema splendidum]|nr:hypothetical protein [Geitlerinema splendidum]